MFVYVRVCLRERERDCVFDLVYMSSVCICPCVFEREREFVCVSVCPLHAGYGSQSGARQCGCGGVW